MKRFSLKSQLALTASAALLAGMMSTPAYAQQGSDPEIQDEIITTGTRRNARSAKDTPAPVDVISGDQFVNQATSDISDLVRIVVPSYNVNTQPISDAATIVRPANLRGLSPDNTLVLLNGKRRHRASVITFLGGGISDGSQGADIGVFPALGLKQVEVLRDGASSQYGSDAIAGVINFKLKDDTEGGMVEVKYGSTYKGDGDNYRIAANAGFGLGDRGFVNITGEYGETDGTVRAVQRTDAAALIAAGNAAVGSIDVNTYTADVVQYWGQPDVKDDMKLFINTGYEVSDNAEIYAFGNYAERTVEGGFFFRNPTNRGGVYAGPTVNPLTGAADPAGVASVRVGDLDGVGVGGTCPAGIPLTAGGGLLPDPTILAAVTADANCFSFVETIPGGFTPRFGGDARDIAITGGVRGELAIGNGLGYDVSYSYGSNKTDFFIRNTVNASLGPNTPRDFVPGAYEQIENAFNLDLTYGVPVEGWASDLNIAAGFEWRDEQFDITQGDAASFALGPLASQGFSSSSNGFGGFNQSTSDSQGNIAIYGELGADISDNFTLEGAVRWEDYDQFGTTTNWKLGGLYKLSDNVRLRATYSTGFHAPTAGQANVRNVTTAFAPGGGLVDQGTLPFDSAPGQLALDFVQSQNGGTRPSLDPETSNNFSAGIGFDTGRIEWTVDFFNIEVKDRIAIVDQIQFIDVLNFVADTNGDGVPDAPGYNNTTVLTGLDTLGAANLLTRSDFNGFEDLTSFAFFSNNFDTKTKGVDIVARVPFELYGAASSLTFAGNYTDTDVKNPGKVSPLGSTKLRQLEENLPKFKGNITLNAEKGMWRGLLRANYHSSYFEAHLDDDTLPIDASSELNFDVEIGAKVTDGFEIIAGAANILNNYPDRNTQWEGIVGSKYPATAPFGFSGGQWYLKGRYKF